MLEVLKLIRVYSFCFSLVSISVFGWAVLQRVVQVWNGNTL